MGSKRLKPKSSLLVEEKDAAAELGISFSNYRAMKARGEGPKITYVGARLYVHIDDLAAWIEALRNPTGLVAKHRDQRIAKLKRRSTIGAAVRHGKL